MTGMNDANQSSSLAVELEVRGGLPGVLVVPARSYAASQVNPSGSVKGPARLPMMIRCDPLPSGETPASLARARRP